MLSARHIVVEKDALPLGWRQSGPRSSVDQFGQIDSYTVEFRYSPNAPIARHDVYCFARKTEAQWMYSDLTDGKRRAFNQITPWQTPQGLQYQSPIAERFHPACADFEGLLNPDRAQTQCIVVAQYSRCVSRFSAWIDPQHMTYDDLHAILTEIDRKVALARELAAQGG
jgi:hypothetical protein